LSGLIRGAWEPGGTPRIRAPGPRQKKGCVTRRTPTPTEKQSAQHGPSKRGTAMNSTDEIIAKGRTRAFDPDQTLIILFYELREHPIPF